MAYTAAVRDSRQAALKALRLEHRRNLERIQANSQDVGRFFDALERLDEVETWYQAKLVALQAQAEARRNRHRVRAGEVLAAIQARGESLSRIAAMTGTDPKTIRELIRGHQAPASDG